MKRILITGGPTNEPVDEVMKITNMSTGSLSMDLAKAAADKGSSVTLIINRGCAYHDRFVRYGFRNHELVRVVLIETTEDMYKALENEAGKPYDTIIHASAVGDYKPHFCFKTDDMAEEITSAIYGKSFGNRAEMENEIFNTLSNPRCKLDSGSKINSYEPHLTIKLTLTMKLISNFREWFGDAKLIAFKLLEDVPKEVLLKSAHDLCIKNDMDYILANDLAELRRGRPVRYLVGKDGFTGVELNGKDGPPLLEYAVEHWF